MKNKILKYNLIPMLMLDVICIFGTLFYRLFYKQIDY